LATAATPIRNGLTSERRRGPADHLPPTPHPSPTRGGRESDKDPPVKVPFMAHVVNVLELTPAGSRGDQTVPPQKDPGKSGPRTTGPCRVMPDATGLPPRFAGPSLGLRRRGD